MKIRRAAMLLCILFLVVPSLVAQMGKSGFVTTSDGIRIHYVEAGSGRPIVFIPGWTMPAWIWQKQTDELSKKYHVIVVDPRSQGESDKPTYGHLPETRAHDYKEVVDHLGLKQPVLVGWSMGCGELMKYVEQFGDDNVGRLVLVDGLLTDKASPEMFASLSEWMNQLQQDRRKQADGFCAQHVQEAAVGRLLEARHRRLHAGSGRQCGRTHLQHDRREGLVACLRAGQSPGAVCVPAGLAAERRLPAIETRRQGPDREVRRRWPCFVRR